MTATAAATAKTMKTTAAEVATVGSVACRWAASKPVSARAIAATARNGGGSDDGGETGRG